MEPNIICTEHGKRGVISVVMRNPSLRLSFVFSIAEHPHRLIAIVAL